MMKVMTGSLICLATFFIGNLVGGFTSAAIDNFATPDKNRVVEVVDEKRNMNAMSPDGVHVTYLGVETSKYRLGSTMVYLIYNGSSETLNCIGYSNTCNFPKISINGVDEKAWVCMNGSEGYNIKPGQTAKLIVGTYDFAKIPGKSEKVSIGIEFELADGKIVQYFAEPMALPTAFRKEVREYILERGSY